jgi:integrase
LCANFFVAAYILGMTARKDRLSDIPAHIEAIRDDHPRVNDHAWKMITRYEPISRNLRGAWAEVRPFTVDTAASMLPETFNVTRRLMSMTARFHCWVWARTGSELTVQAVYTQSHIDRYLAAEHKNSSVPHRYGTSQQIVHVGRVLADLDLVTAPFQGDKVRDAFTKKQIATMHSWANSRTTLLKRQNAWAILGLAGGAGLTSAEIVNARVGDIVRDGELTFVDVHGERDRRVPVRQSWSRALLRSIEGRESADENLFVGFRDDEYPPRVIQHFLSDNPAPVRPTPAALRTSWLMHHIDNNVPATVLQQVSGIQHLQTLVRYYENALPLEVADYTALLTGTEAAR